MKPILAVVLVGTNYSFGAHAMNGLETQLFTFLLLLASLVFVHGQSAIWSWDKAVDFSVICGLGLMTRCDFLIFALALGIPAIISILGTPGPRGFRVLEAPEEVTEHKQGIILLIACLALPAAVIVTPWLVWNAWWHGGILPGAFCVNPVTAISLKSGAEHVYRFFSSYCLFPAFVMAAIPAVPVMIRRQSVLATWSLMTLIWILYVVAVGGCFMEFRLLVPVIPFIMLFLLWMIHDSELFGPLLRPFLLLAIVIGSAVHMAAYRNEGNRIAPIQGSQERCRVMEKDRHVTPAGHRRQAGRDFHAGAGGDSFLGEVLNCL